MELLRDDQATLATCALVCRSWVPISRRHLLLQIVLNRNTVTKATKILLSTTCTIAPSIQHLILDGIYDWHEVCGEDLNLYRLKQITFCNKLQSVKWCVPPCLSHLLHNLENLCLERVHFPSSSALFDLLRHAPQLQSLSCRMVCITDHKASDLPLPDCDELVPKLKSLQLDSCRNLRLFRSLTERRTGAVPALTTLDLNDWSGPFHDFEAYMPALGSSLQVLRLSTWPIFLSRIAQLFTLLTQLHSLSLDYSCYSPSQTTQGLEVAIKALENLTSPHFQELIITLIPEKCGSLNPDTWSALNSLLESPRFSLTLRALVFRFQGGRFKRSHRVIRDRKRWIEKRFLTYAERGILQIE